MALVVDKIDNYTCVLDEGTGIYIDCFEGRLATGTPPVLGSIKGAYFSKWCYEGYVSVDNMNYTVCYDPLRSVVGIGIFVFGFILVIAFVWSLFKKL